MQQNCLHKCAHDLQQQWIPLRKPENNKGNSALHKLLEKQPSWNTIFSWATCLLSIYFSKLKRMLDKAHLKTALFTDSLPPHGAGRRRVLFAYRAPCSAARKRPAGARPRRLRMSRSRYAPAQKRSACANYTNLVNPQGQWSADYTMSVSPFEKSNELQPWSNALQPWVQVNWDYYWVRRLLIIYLHPDLRDIGFSKGLFWEESAAL